MEPMHEAVKSIGVSRTGRPGNHIRTIEGLVNLFEASGLTDIETSPIEIGFKFDDFDDYWSSQSGEIIPDMTGEEIERLKAALRERLPADNVGRICFMGRANGVKGLVAA